MTPDLTGLTLGEAWRYFDLADQDDAVTALRAAMGSSYATTPDDDDLLDALARARDVLEGATGRFFVPRVGQLSIDGSGAYRLWLPYPVASTGQVSGGGVTEILIGDDETALDDDTYVVNDGAGLPGADPRDNPWIDLVAPDSGATFVSRSPEPGILGKWNRGVRNVHVTATWGYLDADGGTPAQIRRLLAGLAIRELTDLDDPDGREDLHRGALTSEATQGRSYTLGERAMGGGITGDRELDVLIARFRAPPRVTIPPVTPRRRYGRRLY